jgi:hypothetical protein
MLCKSYFVILLLIIVIFSISASHAQMPEIDMTAKYKHLQQELKHYQKLYTAQHQITANQEEFDVKYYSIDLIPDPGTQTLTGQVEIAAEVVGSSLDYMELNFWTGMTITDLYKKDAPAAQLTYTHSNEILSINLGATHVQGEEIRVVVVYNGRPQNAPYPYNAFSFSTHNGKPIIGTLSEPYGARSWWPCKDVNSDKADSVDIRVSVPNDLIVASNGNLRAKTTEGDLTTYWWHEQYPIATYLVSLAIHPYIVYYDDYLYNDNMDTMKIHFYQYEDNYNNEDIRYINSLVTDMISFFSEIYGQYPFIEEKYGHADYHIGGAMEHQTCSSFAFWNESVFAHELAHQWWGDLVTCEDFHHIWLNEGFATYSEALWFEHAYPDYITASDYMTTYSLYLGGGSIYVENPEGEPWTIFSGDLSYNKAAWVMHMLRHVVGDDIFFEILQTYGASEEHRFGDANTSEFQAICEQVSGLKLNKFFQQWIYGEYQPYYSYGWNMKDVEGGYQIQLGIDQIQDNTSLYWMPIDIKVTTSFYDTVFVVWDSLASQTFEFFISEEPLTVELDPDDWILKRTEQKLLPPFAENILVNNPYQIPGVDTLIITSEANNPENHDLELELVIDSDDESIIETLSMYDDGIHKDSDEGDGIFGVSWPVPPGERTYSVKIKTLSLDNGFSNVLENAAYFTTKGPVELDYYQIVSADSIPNPGDFIGFEFHLINNGKMDSVYNISSKLISLDACAQVVALSDPVYGDLEPGGKSVASRPVRIRFDADCPAPANYDFALEIYSDDKMLWKDSFSLDVVTSISEVRSLLPKEYALDQNYPNPFNPSTMINYQLPKTSDVELSIYNLLGQKVVTLVSERMEAGYHQVEWDASGLSSGVYFYRITAGEFVQVKKMILVR